MDLTTFNESTYQELVNYLNKIKDIKYKEFQEKIIKNSNIMGVRSIELKKIAKEISKHDYNSFIENNNKDIYELKMIEGYLYGYLKIEYRELEKYLNKYINKLDNWSLVDLTVANLKLFNKHEDECFKYARKLIQNKNTYIKRFGIILLLNYCLHDTYIEKVLDIISRIRISDYYVKMAVAWTMSVAYIKYKEITLLYLVNLKDKETYDMTLQKIIDSNRISKKEKDFIKNLKKK